MDNITLTQNYLTPLVKRTALLLFASILVLGAMGNVYAEQGTQKTQFNRGSHAEGGHANAQNHEQRRKMMQQKLGLSDEQVKSLESAREGGRAESAQLKKQLMEKKKALMQYMGTPGATKAHALSMQNDVLRIEKQLGEIRINSWFKMREILSPEQLEKMKSMREQMMKNRGPQSGSQQEGGMTNRRKNDNNGLRGDRFSGRRGNSNGGPPEGGPPGGDDGFGF